MSMTKITLSNFTLLVALSLSTIAAYYSIAGLVAIFAGAVIPIIVMGSILEVAKITTSVWLRKYWHLASWKIKTYLVSAVFLIAILTSMGIFGFLSKAHIDQGAPLGDVAAKVSLLDEKIKTQKENIAAARAALSQLDAQINTIITKGDSEKSAERSVQIRRQQAKERAQLQKEIEQANAEIAKLNDERAPAASELRKTEVEVGPIKYIASLIYGDSIDQNILEKAVRWVIILLVIVFDPLAIALVLAANQSKDWDKGKTNQEPLVKDEPETEIKNDLTESPKKDIIPVSEEVKEIIEPPIENSSVEGKMVYEKDDIAKLSEFLQENLKSAEEETKIIDKPEHAYLKKPWIWKIFKSEENKEEKSEIKENITEVKENLEIKENTEVKEPTIEEPIKTEGVTTQPFHVIPNTEYIEKDGKQMHKSVFAELNPDLLPLVNATEPKTEFGTNFPKFAMPGDIFVRVDIIPNKTFKFDGSIWAEVNDKPINL